MALNTTEMQNEIIKADNIYDLIDSNSDSFRTESVSEHLKKLIKDKDIKLSDAVIKGNLDRSYTYQILSGKKTPSRDKLLALSFGMSLSLDETNELLKISRNHILYSRDERDAVIIFSISHGKGLIEANELLFENGFQTIN